MAVDVLAQIDVWRSKLLDLTKRNRLINCKVGAKAALQLVHPTPDSLWRQLIVSNETLTFIEKTKLAGEQSPPNPPVRGLSDARAFSPPVQKPSRQQGVPLEECLRSPRLKSDHILTSLADDVLASRLKRLSQNAQTTLDEQGVNTLFVGFGMLEWFEADHSSEPLLSPVILIPVTLSRTDSGSSWQLAAEEEDILPNQCLHEILKAQFHLTLPELLDPDSDVETDPFGYFDQIRAVLKNHSLAARWRISPDVVLGTFSFQKVAMWQDLGKNAGLIAEHGLCRAVAGDLAGVVHPISDMPAPAEFDDRLRPHDVHSILDSDGSQLEAIVAARHGVSLVIDGPPGTGKSQTIANVIAECLADGKTVLFVSEKSTALEVVKRRLDEHHLGDFCLECHSHKTNKKDIIAELKRCLELPVEEYRDQTRDLDQLTLRRSQLNGYVRALHRRVGALQMTPFEVHGLLASLKGRASTRCQIPDPLNASESNFRAACELLKGLPDCQQVLANFEHHPWRGAKPDSISFSLQDDVRSCFTSLAHDLQRANQMLQRMAAFGLVGSSPTYPQMLECLVQTERVLSYPTFPVAWLSGKPRELCQNVQSLQQVEHEVSRISEEMPEFDFTNAQPPTDCLTCIAELRTNPLLARLQTNRVTTVRALHKQATVAAEALARMRADVMQLGASLGNLGRVLKVPLPAEPAIKTLRTLAQVGTIIADTGPMKAEWFNNDVRGTLLRAASECCAQRAACEDLLKAKACVWTSQAAGDAGKIVAYESRNFGTWWSRLWGVVNGSWSRFKASASYLYAAAPPKSARVLMQDMATLREIHRFSEIVHQQEAIHRDQLIFDQNGRPNWNALHAGVDAIERLQAIVTIPSRLQRALSADGDLDRPALKESAEAIKRGLDAVQSEAKTLEASYSLASCSKKNTPYQDMSCNELVTWLTQAEQALQQLLAQLQNAISALRPDADLSIADVARRSTQLGRRHECLQRSDQLKLALAGVPGLNSPRLVDGPHISPTDWEAVGRLQQLLEVYGDCPPPVLADLVTSAAGKATLRQAFEELNDLVQKRLQPLWEELAKIFPLSSPVSTGIVIENTPLDACVPWLEALANDVARLGEWTEFQDIRARLCQFGLETIVGEVLAGELTASDAERAYRGRFFRAWLDHVYRDDPALSRFRIDEHETTVAAFRQLDRDFVRGSYKRIRAKLLADSNRPRVGTISAPPSSEVGILLRQAGRKRKQMPVRQLLGRIPSVLQRLKPCVMMSPLAVSTFLDSPDVRFDVVIFDEASQVRPFDAIGAIYRGRQLVVAGDQQQLPPSNFFDRMDADDEGHGGEDADDESLTDFESILDVCCSLGLPRKRLRWHYRSRRESLIAFSNHFFYGNELVTFPSVLDTEGCSAVRLHYVNEGRWLPGKSGGYNPVEARATAELIARHYDTYPDRSLGVITFNQRQQTAVKDSLEEIFRERPDLEARIKDCDSEELFIKNLETVQGDERDHIILSVGYGFDHANNFAMRFGPLNQVGGGRRLNVAVTRARFEAVLVSSVRADNIDLSRTQSQGAELLKSYLDFASRGVSAIHARISEMRDAECDSPFEYEVEQALLAKDLRVRRQVGCSGFRIDLALVHPQYPGRYVLGVECDGATYHRSATARDRDRLRQEVLEGLGWRICRVWSTDWLRDPQRQIQRILSAYEEELARLSSEPTSQNNSQQLPEAAVPDEERPILRLAPREKVTGIVGFYSNIDEVPEQILHNAIRQLLRSFGQTSRDELVRTVARQLGFQRAGRRIQARIEAALAHLKSSGDLTHSSDDQLSVG